MKPTYSIKPTDDLGALHPAFAVEHMSRADLDAWLDKHGEQGTYTIVDDRDGLPVCVFDLFGGPIGNGCTSCGLANAVGPLKTLKRIVEWTLVRSDRLRSWWTRLADLS